MFKQPKTKTSARTVAVPATLARELDHHLRSWPATGDDQLVFTAPEGCALRRNNFRRRVWLPAVRSSVGGELRFHDLRHTHAALLIAEGEDPYVISKRLGHASIKTTYDIYGHLFEGQDDAAANRLDGLMTETEQSDKGSRVEQRAEASRAQETRRRWDRTSAGSPQIR